MERDDEDGSRLLPRARLAARLGVSNGTVMNREKAGLYTPDVRRKHRVLYRLDTIEKIVARDKGHDIKLTDSKRRRSSSPSSSSSSSSSEQTRVSSSKLRAPLPCASTSEVVAATNRYTSENAADAFAAFDEGMSLVDVVKTKKMFPAIVKELHAQWVSMTGGLYLAPEKVATLARLELSGAWPPRSADDLVETIVVLSKARSGALCARCKSQPRVVCKACVGVLIERATTPGEEGANGAGEMASTLS